MHKIMSSALTALLLMPFGTSSAATCDPTLDQTTPDTELVDNGDGTITDLGTGLMWKKCSEGQLYDPSTGGCTGSSALYGWGAALQHAASTNSGVGFAGHQDWVVPNLKQLQSIIERACHTPAINERRFPGVLYPHDYWTSTPSARNLGQAWIVDMHNGDVSVNGAENRLRLVRVAQ